MRIFVKISFFALLLAGPVASQYQIHSFLSQNPASLGNPTLGRAADGGEDLNGDGVPDLVVASAGEVSALSGLDGSCIRSYFPPVPDLSFGSQCRLIGDIDQDGSADIIVASHDFANGAGDVFVFSGASASLIHILSPPDPSAAFGISVSGLGDVNGDGIPDIAVGAPRGLSALASDAAYVYSGSNGALLRTIIDVSGTSAQGTFWGFGLSVCSAGDLDGDGSADLVVGCRRVDPLFAFYGYVQAFSGSTGASLFQYLGTVPGERLGVSIDSAGDINQDGIDDILAVSATASISFPPGQIYFGSLRVISGFDGSEIRRINAPPFGNGFSASTRNAGDVDADGCNDFIVQRNTVRASFSLYSGADGHEIFSAEASDFALPFSPAVICPAGDMNQDGYNDVALAVQGGFFTTTTTPPSTIRVAGQIAVYSNPPALSLLAFGDAGPSLSPSVNSLAVNGSSGGLAHRVDSLVGSPLTISLPQPASNPNPVSYAIFGRLGVPEFDENLSIVLNPSPPLLSSDFVFAPCPLAPWDARLFTLAATISLPCTPLVGASPGGFNLVLPNGLPFPATFTLQAVFEHSPGVLQTSNAIIVRTL